MPTNKKNGFRLDSLKAVEKSEEEGTWVDVKHPDGRALYLGGQKETPLRIKVVGRHSHTYRQAQKKARKLVFNDDADQRGLAVLGLCTLGWEGAFDDEGVEIPFSPENATMLYEAGYFIAEQVDLATFEHERFFKSGSPS